MDADGLNAMQMRTGILSEFSLSAFRVFNMLKKKLRGQNRIQFVFSPFLHRIYIAFSPRTSHLVRVRRI